jgi:hypothetical protein
LPAFEPDRKPQSLQCRKVATEKGVSLPILLDETGHTADFFGTDFTTTTVVIDATGVLRYYGQFAHDNHAYAEAALAVVLKGQPVASPTTPHQGCPIARLNNPRSHGRALWRIPPAATVYRADHRPSKRVFGCHLR